MASKTELKVAAALLALAENTFANHGCNDFDLTEIIPDIEERNRLFKDMCIWNGEPEEYDETESPSSPSSPDWRMQDWMLMAYLAAKLRKETE